MAPVHAHRGRYSPLPGISVTAAAKGISFFIQRDVLSRHSGIINQKDRCRKAGYSSANDVGVPFFYAFRCGSLVKQIVNVHGIHSFLKSFQNSVEITTLSIL